MATVTPVRVNNQKGSLGTSLTTATTGTVATFFASNWTGPTTAATHFLRITLTPTTPTFEIIHGQATNGAKTFTITARAQETTSAVAHTVGRTWEHSWTALDGQHAADTSLAAGAVFSGPLGSAPPNSVTTIPAFTSKVPVKTTATEYSWHNTTGHNVVVYLAASAWSTGITGITFDTTASLSTWLNQNTATLFLTGSKALTISYGAALGTKLHTFVPIWTTLSVPANWHAGVKVSNVALLTATYVGG